MEELVGTWDSNPRPLRVNFEVSNPEPFPYLAFPRSKTERTPSRMPSFDGELNGEFLTASTRRGSVVGVINSSVFPPKIQAFPDVTRRFAHAMHK